MKGTESQTRGSEAEEKAKALNCRKALLEVKIEKSAPAVCRSDSKISRTKTEKRGSEKYL